MKKNVFSIRKAAAAVFCSIGLLAATVFGSEDISRQTLEAVTFELPSDYLIFTADDENETVKKAEELFGIDTETIRESFEDQMKAGNLQEGVWAVDLDLSHEIDAFYMDLGNRELSFEELKEMHYETQLQDQMNALKLTEESPVTIDDCEINGIPFLVISGEYLGEQDYRMAIRMVLTVFDNDVYLFRLGSMGKALTEQAEETFHDVLNSAVFSKSITQSRTGIHPLLIVAATVLAILLLVFLLFGTRQKRKTLI